MSIIKSSAILSLTQHYRSALCPFKHADSPKHQPSAAINERVGLVRGDITRLELDAIVNAANTSLMGGGGVDGAIHRAAGRFLVKECAAIGGCPTGEARITSGYNLPAKHVIHTVGPIYDSKAVSEPLLRSCYEKSLQLAVDKGLTSVAFSGISTGIYGYPTLDAARVACDTVRRFLEKDQTLTQVVFVTFLDKDVNAYDKAIPEYFPEAK
jgi:O-acetyl-ADP-ribose deacetylase (regulator of RNase III)